MSSQLVSAPSQPIVLMEHIQKTYWMGQQAFPALRDVSLSVAAGEYVAIIGPSGSGKSTTMHIMGCLDTPSAGLYRLDGYDVSKLSDDDLALLRNQKIGFVFQSFNLLSRTSAIENVELPMLYAGVPAKVRHQRAQDALVQVGLESRMHHKPNELSGGQQQRVAIARALVTHPALILADEPTGALDSQSTEEIMGLFQNLHDQGNAIVMVTHELDVAHHAHRIISFKDGVVQSDVPNPDFLRRPAPAVQQLEGGGH